MNKVTVNTPKPYDILIGAGLLGQIPQLLQETLAAEPPAGSSGGPPASQSFCIVTDDIVYDLYGKTLESSLNALDSSQ